MSYKIQKREFKLTEDERAKARFIRTIVDLGQQGLKSDLERQTFESFKAHLFRDVAQRLDIEITPVTGLTDKTEVYGAVDLSGDNKSITAYYVEWHE